MFEPMSLRSMCGHDRFSSKASAPASWHAFASVCQCASSVSLPDPAMIDAMSMRSGCAFLIRSRRGTHQSSVLSEMSSQFHDEWSAVSGRFCIDRRPSSVVRRNFVLGPATFVTGWRPMVLVTTPPQPASNARMMLRVGLGRRRRREQEGVGELQARERDAELRVHGGTLTQEGLGA